MKKVSCLFVFLMMIGSISSHASIDQAERVFQKNRSNLNVYLEVVENLVDARYYFSAVPFLKEYLVRGEVKKNKQLDRLLDEVVRAVGIMQFEVMPESSLRHTNSPMVKYILAKKLFRKGNYKEALEHIRRTIPDDHPIKPYALHLQGTALSLLRDYSDAKYSYEECMDVSEKAISSAKYIREKRQLQMNRDYCVAGIARNLFTEGKYLEAEQAYLDLEKSSQVWPEILFDEAWTSFYLKKFNRTLGKLVTYKSPFFSHIFNPEIEVLQAMAYLQMCLWGDTRKVVDDFYNKYESQSEKLYSYINNKGNDFKLFFSLPELTLKRNISDDNLLKMMLQSLTYDPAYLEMRDAYERGRREIDYVKKLKRSRFRSILVNNLNDVVILQRDLIGSYIKKGLSTLSYRVEQTFAHMSYIKLEVIRNKKDQIYNAVPNTERTRGDIQYLERSDKQYFWTFNGEFWADELGDYVFALRSECDI